MANITRMVNGIFVKYGKPGQGTSFFREYKGLELLRKYQDVHEFKIPKVLSVTRDYIELEHIDITRPTSADWAECASKLLKLHSIEAQSFGLDHDNFIGQSTQINSQSDCWGEFFFQHRLTNQAKKVKDRSTRQELLEYIEIHKFLIIDFLNSHHPKPSLVHGDLWRGNVVFDREGPWLIDPALHFGDREVDLAMTRMFGNFPVEFYQSYFTGYLVAPNFDLRSRIYNLYHYLNHFNIFGDNYWSGIEDGLAAIDSL